MRTLPSSCSARSRSRATRKAIGVPCETLSYSIANAFFAAEPVGDVRRRLPHRPVLPRRAVVDDASIVSGSNPVSSSRRSVARDREIAHVLVGRRDVLAAQPELLDDHLLRDAGRSRDLGSGDPPLRKVRSGRLQSHAPHSFASRMQRMIRSSSSDTRDGHAVRRRPRGSSAYRSARRAPSAPRPSPRGRSGRSRRTRIAFSSAVDVALGERGRSGSWSISGETNSACRMIR